MAIPKEEESREEQILLDALYCEEEKWEDEEDEVEENSSFSSSSSSGSTSPLVLLQQDLFWEDEDLVTLFTKEEEQGLSCVNDVYLATDRKEAVGWILRVNSRYGFSTLAAVLAITYLDKFICSYSLQRDKPWMLQLVSVACLSLAAKVEETHVPLLLDFQVEETKYVFEAKTIQRMELLILSTLQWKMHLITPLSFLDHVIRRLGLKNNAHWDFLNSCHRLILSVISDSRFVGYLPSVVAAATMMRIIEQVEPFDPLSYQTKLLGVLNITKEKVKPCYELILQLPLNRIGLQIETQSSRKRKSGGDSPSCVIDSNPFNSDESSNDSWWSASSCDPPSSSQPPLKKMRVDQETQKEKPVLHLPWAIVATP
ncbi:Cyclin-D3-1 [Raphanus sativus]|uniref:Cyclin-D3-1 n=1 Tax=Raphanus sativus TaxID=3726 RepID=A0A6J0MF29_RAPSA|nr:cyclin-D3-1 [Raphanus sativus]XP_056859830.1 cyclin-D3-1-like [Raphanus sativus]KAJ4873086.1 Cyclin-D3-1 [Raphanus sativus]KAJ4914255.1 Cyclin-D3-1 [Raphanus sativus]